MAKLTIEQAFEQIDDRDKQFFDSGDFGSISDSAINFLGQNLDENGMEELEFAMNPPALPAGLTQDQVSATRASGTITEDVPIEFAQGAAMSRIGESLFGEEPLSAITGKDVGLSAQGAAREGIEMVGSIAGFAAGAASPVKGASIPLSMAGELAMRRGTRRLGLRSEGSAMTDIVEVGAGEMFGVGAEGAFRALHAFMPKAVRDAVNTGEGRLFDQPEDRILDVVIGGEKRKATDLASELDGKDSILTTSQLTGGVVGRESAEQLAHLSAKESFRKGKSLLEKRHEEALNKRASEILKGVSPKDFSMEGFTESLNTIISGRIKEINSGITTQSNIISAANISSGKAKVIDLSDKPDGFRQIVNTFLHGKKGDGNSIADQLGVDGIDERDLISTFNDILETVTEKTTRTEILGADGKPFIKGGTFLEIPKSISLKQYDMITARIDKLKGSFSSTQIAQKQMAGVLARFEREVLDPMVSASALKNRDVGLVQNARTMVRRGLEQRSELQNAKLAQSVGVTKQAQSRNLKSGEKSSRGALSDAETFLQTKKLLEAAGDDQLLPAIENNFVVDIWTNHAVKDSSESRLGKGSGVELSHKKLGAYLANPENRRLVSAVKGDEYLESLDKVSEWLRVRDSDPVLMSSLSKNATADGASLGELAGQKILAKVGGHSLRDSSISVAILNNLAKMLLGRQYSEAELLAKLTDPSFLKKFNNGLNTVITDDKAFVRVNAMLREFGAPIAREGWDALVDLMQTGQLDTIPRDLIDDGETETINNE